MLHNFFFVAWIFINFWRPTWDYFSFNWLDSHFTDNIRIKTLARNIINRASRVSSAWNWIDLFAINLTFKVVNINSKCIKRKSVGFWLHTRHFSMGHVARKTNMADTCQIKQTPQTNRFRGVIQIGINIIRDDFLACLPDGN